MLPLESYHPGQIERVLRDIHRFTFKKGRQLQLLIVILPDFSDSSYGEYQTRTLNVLSGSKMKLKIRHHPDLIAGTIKRICETELGIVSQCCDYQKVKKANRQYLENLALKINVKVCSLYSIHCL